MSTSAVNTDVAPDNVVVAEMLGILVTITRLLGSRPIVGL